MQITFNMFNFVQLCCHCVKSHLPKILMGLCFQEIQLDRGSLCCCTYKLSFVIKRTDYT